MSVHDRVLLQGFREGRTRAKLYSSSDTLVLRYCQVVDCRRILKWTYAYGYYRFAESAQAQTSAHSSTSRRRPEAAAGVLRVQPGTPWRHDDSLAAFV